MIRKLAIAAIAAALCGCASKPPPPPAPIALVGTLDLTKPGIDIHVTDDAETVACDAHYAQGKLPEAVTLPLTCADARTGTLSLVKALDLRGTAIFSDGQTGTVSFASTPQVAAPTPPPTAAPPAPVSPASYVYPRSHRSSTGYVRGHYRSATYVHGYYRNGHYVSGHARRGSYVHSYYRRRR
jgi:hypothetical protein